MPGWNFIVPVLRFWFRWWMSSFASSVVMWPAEWFFILLSCMQIRLHLITSSLSCIGMFMLAASRTPRPS